MPGRQSRSRSLLLASLLLLLVPASAGAIVGGKPTTRAWPALVQLRIDGEFSCAGNLVRSDWVLTAAHCVDGVEPISKLDVVAGRARLSGTDGEVIPLAQVVRHPDYASRAAASHDIALLKLAGAPANATPIRVIDVAEAGRLITPGRPLTVVGWGAQVSGGPVSDVLREVDVPFVSDSNCALTVGLTEGFDAATLFCAGELLGGRDSCQGDSGGPVVLPGADGALVLGGTVSSGLGCAFPTQYGLYARIGGAELHGFLDRTLPPVTAAPAGAGANPPPSPSPSPPASGADPPAAAVPVSLRVSRVTGSAGRRRAVLSVRTSAAVSRVRATLRAAGRTVGSARRTRLRRGTTRIVVRLRRSVRSVGVSVSARDANGRVVRATRRARLAR